jgi:hypothetical protein
LQMSTQSLWWHWQTMRRVSNRFKRSAASSENRNFFSDFFKFQSFFRGAPPIFGGAPAILGGAPKNFFGYFISQKMTFSSQISAQILSRKVMKRSCSRNLSARVQKFADVNTILLMTCSNH